MSRRAAGRSATQRGDNATFGCVERLCACQFFTLPVVERASERRAELRSMRGLRARKIKASSGDERSRTQIARKHEHSAVCISFDKGDTSSGDELVERIWVSLAARVHLLIVLE